MNKIKQSFSWWCVSQQAKDPKAFLQEMKKIGYQGVEMPPRELYDTVRDTGLVVATDLVGSLTEGWNRRENHAKLEDEFGKKLELAVKYKVPNLIVFSGNRAGLSDEQGAINTAEGLRRLAKPAEAKGVTVVLELLNSKVDHVDYQCDHTLWGVLVMTMVNSPRVKLLYDIYHMQIMEGDVIRTLRAHLGQIGHLHTAGNPGRHGPDDTQEINYRAVAAAIAAAGYRGFVAHEFSPTGDKRQALERAFRLFDAAG